MNGFFFLISLFIKVLCQINLGNQNIQQEYLAFLIQFQETTSNRRLLFKRLDLSFQFIENIFQTVQILLSLIQLGLCFLATRLKFQDTCSFFKDSPAFFRFGVKDFLYTTLGDNRERIPSQSRIHEQIMHISETYFLTIDLVLTVS